LRLFFFLIKIKAIMSKQVKTAVKTPDIQIFKVVNISMSDIIPPKLAMRIGIEDKSFESLVQSIKDIGLISPIVVMKFADKFEIVAGDRRYRACKALNWDYVPASILEPNSEKYFRTMSAENYERQDVSLFDEIQFIMKLHDELSLNQTQTAKYIGKSVAYVNERIAVTNYPQCLKDALIDDKITFSVAREFSKISEAQVCEQYLHYAIENGCTPAIARKWRQQWENQKANPNVTPLDIMEEHYESSQQKVTVNQDCASCHGTFEAQELLPLYVCKACRTALVT
jgi:ParB family chromosome partitioning protein